MRLTGGEFAAGRLPEMYYGQFIKAAREGGMAAVCATEQYRERIAANPANRERLMRMDPKATSRSCRAGSPSSRAARWRRCTA